MEKLFLVRPAAEHEKQYEEMMDEWEKFGGRLNPGALRRFSNLQQQNVTYAKWLKWIEEDRQAEQDLYFFINGEIIIGAISIRFKKDTKSIGNDGHTGYGIRPSERNKGYATKMLSMALPIMREYKINPVIITCDKDNIASAKTAMNNGGHLVKEVVDECTGKVIQFYQIDL